MEFVAAVEFVALGGLRRLGSSSGLHFGVDLNVGLFLQLRDEAIVLRLEFLLPQPVLDFLADLVEGASDARLAGHG